MKFGLNLPQSQVPEWATAYIDYKGLKKLIKDAVERSKSKEERPDTAAFFYALDRNLEDIDGFYNKKFADASRRLKLLQDQYGKSQEDPTSIDRDEAEDLTNALLELRSSFRKLQWYGEVNRRGFVKITKKLDKKLGLPKGKTQRPYIEAKVDLRPFAKDTPLLDLMSTVNDWLSKLGEVTSDEEHTRRPPFSLSRVPSRTKLNLPQGLADSIDSAIRLDDPGSLSDFLKKAPAEYGADATIQRLLLSLLNRSIARRATECMKMLLERLDSLEDAEDMNQRNPIHRFLVSLNREQQAEKSANGQTSDAIPNGQFITPAAPPVAFNGYPVKESDDVNLSGLADKALKLLDSLLDSLKPAQRKSLMSRDAIGRIPLHYAARYGFAAMCKIIVDRMKLWDQFEVELGIHAPWLRDAENASPIHHAVARGHPLSTQTLLESLQGALLKSEYIKDWQIDQKLGECLAAAVKADYTDIVQLLLEHDAIVNYQNDEGETPLHLAVRLGKNKALKVLLNTRTATAADLEIQEKTFQWTPLFYACKEGNLEAVDLLLAAGARAATPDPSGWTAQEHAALRGHLDVAQKLNAHLNRGPPTTNGLGPATADAASKPKKAKALPAAGANGDMNGTVIKTEAVKTFGHRYLTDKTMILVSLGTMNMNSTEPAVDLKQIPVAEAHRTQLDTALSIVVTAEGADGEPEVVDLPVQDNVATEPFTFMTTDHTKTVLHFDVVPTYSGSTEKIIGRGSAILSSCSPAVGSKRAILKADVTIPIHASQSLKIIGTVHFNFLVITPFKHERMKINERHTFWKKTTQAMVIGHRGLGKNMNAKKALQLGENTIQSFVSAANLGAAYVEFDVQLTKDLVPIIYHDFLVSETGIDAPVHTVTLEQFLHFNPEKSTNGNAMPSPPLSSNNSDVDKTEQPPPLSLRGRAYSHSTIRTTVSDNGSMNERMKHTRDFKAKGFKANSRGNFIQEPFTTLEKMFRTLPLDLSFNIEMKYPMLFESEEHEMDHYAIDMNTFVDTVLKVVYDLGHGRDVIFSSFNPDMCLMLAFKQPSMPVLFLTDAGASAVGDIRASSLQEAIRFASRWDLLGIVSQARAFVLSPRLISLVKENGLMCISYGSQNNDADLVQLQENEGIDAVITDDILTIKKARLTKQSTSVANGNDNGISGEANGPASINVTPIDTPVLKASV